MIAGPTGTGKTEIAVAVAERIGGEIVSCDALQVYRGLDAATAKPSREQRERVRHWLVDVADPRRDYSVADYVRDADASIADIRARRRVPLIVGGSGMYLRGLLKGIVAAPPRDEALRSRLRAMVERFGPQRVHKLLARWDSESASRIGPGDTQRIIRALELALPRGDTWSERLAREGTWSQEAERYRSLKFALDLERATLALRLAARVEAFFAADLPGEVERLLASGVSPGANAFKGIGYREVIEALSHGQDPAGAREAIVTATRQYAKRQRTWFRKEPGLVWVDAAAGVEALAARIAAAWVEALGRGGAMSAC